MDTGILDTIHSPADVHKLSRTELHTLCDEIRHTLLAYGHVHGGHIGSNLGMVEATVALHRVFDSPYDRIVFDVSHQSYVHKMLTGRAYAYLDPSRFGEVTGFTNPEESVHDQFVLGHTGTSISLACGLAKTRDMERATRDGDSSIGNVIAVIGDGSLSSGIAFEGLNNAAAQGGNLIIILNDNEMSIAGDFGGMYGPLAKLRASGGTAQPNLFNAFGLDYRYVDAGNDVDALVEAFTSVKDIDHPIVVHIHTLKGMGFSTIDSNPSDNTAYNTAQHTARNAAQCQLAQATHEDVSTPHNEQISTTDCSCSTAPTKLSAHTPVNADTAGHGVYHKNVSHAEPWHSDHCDLSDIAPHAGQCEASHWQTPDAALNRPDDPRKHYGKMAMAALEPRFASEPGLVVISPATPGSNGITHEFRERAGAHYVDTGITESHAITFAAGIARAGGTPVVATTASFFQRAYDQFFQEMSLNRSRVTILDFLGGLSGSDNTHSGAYDVMMFANIPGVTMLAPTSGADFLADLAWSTLPSGSQNAPNGPVVIRVPGETILERDRRIAAAQSGATAQHATKLDDVQQTAQLAAQVNAAKPNTTSNMLSWRVNQHGSRIAILGLGNAYPLAERVAEQLHDDDHINATLIDPRQCSTLDIAALDSLRSAHQLVVTLEDGQLEGGWGEKITAYYANHRTSTNDRGMERTMDRNMNRTMDSDANTITNSTPAIDTLITNTSIGNAIRAIHDITSTGNTLPTPRVINIGASKEFTDRVSLTELNRRYGLTVDGVIARIREHLPNMPLNQ